MGGKTLTRKGIKCKITQAKFSHSKWGRTKKFIRTAVTSTIDSSAEINWALIAQATETCSTKEARRRTIEIKEIKQCSRARSQIQIREIGKQQAFSLTKYCLSKRKTQIWNW